MAKAVNEIDGVRIEIQAGGVKVRLCPSLKWFLVYVLWFRCQAEIRNLLSTLYRKRSQHFTQFIIFLLQLMSLKL